MDCKELTCFGVFGKTQICFTLFYHLCFFLNAVNRVCSTSLLCYSVISFMLLGLLFINNYIFIRPVKAEFVRNDTS